MKYKRVKELEPMSCLGCIFDQEGCQSAAGLTCGCEFGFIYVEDKTEGEK